MTQGTTTYEPKVGDYVDLRVRGKVTTYRQDTGSVVVEWGPNQDHLVTHRGSYTFNNGEEGITITPAQAPEPEWNTGDVVKVRGYLPFIRTLDGRWVGPSENPGAPSAAQKVELVKEAWYRGDLAVLYAYDDGLVTP